MTTTAEWWTKVLLGGSGQLGGRRTLGAERYALLPGRGDPRVVVDVTNRRAVSDSLRRFAKARAAPNWGQSLAGRAAPVATRLAPQWTFSADPAQRTLRQHLSDVLEVDVRLSISVGPPRPNRKPVVRCYAGRDVVAVAKVGPDPHTANMVRNEAEWLENLGLEPLDDVITPTLLHSGDFGPNALLVMSALPLVSDAGVGFAEIPSSVLVSLRERHRSVGISNSVYWSTLQRRLHDVRDEVISSAADRVRCDPAASTLSTTMWHGDWSPWNVGRANTGQWCVWDWERASIGVPTGFDLAHLHHQYGDGLESSQRALSTLGISGEHIALTWRMYLLELAARHSEADSLASDRHSIVRQLLRRDAEGSLGVPVKAPGKPA